MTFDVNDGRRPDLLELGRRAGGELPEPLDPEYGSALERSRQAVAPFDWKMLSAAAARAPAGDLLAPAPDPLPATGRLQRWWRVSLGLGVPLLAAAAALVVVVMPPSDPTGVRAKGGATLSYDVWRDGAASSGPDGRPLGAGDKVQFSYAAGSHETMVLLSIDGDGHLSLFYPATGDRAELVEPGGPHRFADSIELDDAPGPEVFVAIFGVADVADATGPVVDAWEQRGLAGLEALDREDPDIAIAIIPRE
jgi:hypothetical protein